MSMTDVITLNQMMRVISAVETLEEVTDYPFVEIFELLEGHLFSEEEISTMKNLREIVDNEIQKSYNNTQTEVRPLGVEK